jgi:hypothetical protein
MAIPFSQSSIQWLDLILRRIPEHLEVLFSTFTLAIELPVHPVHDLLVGATLKWNHLALVVESEVEVKGNLNATSASVQRTRDYG